MYVRYRAITLYDAISKEHVMTNTNTNTNKAVKKSHSAAPVAPAPMSAIQVALVAGAKIVHATSEGDILAKLHNTQSGALIVSAIKEGLDGSQQSANGLAHLVSGIFAGLVSGEMSVSQARTYVSTQDKDAAKKYIGALCGTYSAQYNAALDAINAVAQKTGKTDDMLVSLENAGRTIKAVKQMFQRGVLIAFYVVDQLKASKCSLHQFGGMYIEGMTGKDGTSSSMRTTTTELETKARAAFVKRPAATAKGQGTSATEGNAPVKLTTHNAAQFISKTYNGKAVKDLSKGERDELQSLLVTLIGVFGGVDKIAGIYKVAANG